MRLSIIHRTHYAYNPVASRVALRIRLYPSEFDGQSAPEWSVTVNGGEVAPLFTDGFGDKHGLWNANAPCPDIKIVAMGSVETLCKAGIVGGLSRRPSPDVFLRTTGLTRPDSAIVDLAQRVAANETLSTLHRLSDAIREAIAYRSGSTDHATTAAEALKLKSGVCQDHAHVFISAARSLRIPARYVVGYMIASDDINELHETHAWAEAHVDDLGWVAFDPSNGVCPTERYVRLACGLDANHAAPLRGCVVGNSSVNLEASVDISQVQQ